ncbi:MAG: hypothetical protein U9R25_12715 [Chloroflexota bacterium]|nr:hypothetical protein [Chloroflexota bacterium]
MQIFLPLLLILGVIGVGLVLASLNDRFAKLEKEIEALHTELLFLRGELDLLQRRSESDET